MWDKVWKLTKVQILQAGAHSCTPADCKTKQTASYCLFVLIIRQRNQWPGLDLELFPHCRKSQLINYFINHILTCFSSIPYWILCLFNSQRLSLLKAEKYSTTKHKKKKIVLKKLFVFPISFWSKPWLNARQQVTAIFLNSRGIKFSCPSLSLSGCFP